MKILSFGCLAAILALTQASAEAAKRYPIEPGDVILANCHEIYSKGIVKAKVDDGYTVDFPKGSGPLHCPPFRWHAEYVLPFQSVPEYRLTFFGGLKNDALFRIGDIVTFRFQTDKRIVNGKAMVDIEAKITDISSNGAIATKLISTSPDASATFWQWVGGNYIDLRHPSLDAERAKRSH
jgi:hypothetical protein